ncbi:L,D-transpeptidase family protein [Arenibaculum sp.]|uniref:L,D-transpeptidase family protein n=1 Tax=Arenibaculum sp. TaxID=2865862 RepID=UPI002E121C65|nr:L,D-transpeptidase family protein [Arenibaculum sp.]
MKVAVRLTRAGFIAILLAIPLQSAARTTDAGPVPHAQAVQPLRMLLSAPAPSVDGEMLKRPTELLRFYAERGDLPAWSAEGEMDPRAGSLLDLFVAADREGLDPRDYHAAAIAARLARAQTGPHELAELDLLLTDAVMQYAGHLRAGRIQPRSIDADLALVPPPVDVVAAARHVLSAPDPAAALAGFAPPHTGYAALRQGLAELRAFAARGGWSLAGPGPVLKPGMIDPSVPPLRRRLAATGDFAGADLASEFYDVELEQAVRGFQERMGLGVDGVVGPRTRSALNISIEERIDQVIANLERWRWLPDQLGDRYVAVNVPGYSLEAIEGGEVRLAMPVIVGSKSRETPVLGGKISHLVLNPTWTIPETIARKDVLPKVIEDPGYLIAQGIRVFDGWSADAPMLDPYAVDWKAVGTRITRYRLRQEPGPLNALGRVKFMFPNEFDVYLHDTPQRGKFSRAVRTLSSGCVRVGDPEALTAFLVEGMNDWPQERRSQVLDGGATTTVWLRRPVPVYLLYRTAWRDDDGRMVFRPDIYDRDPRLIEALGRRNAPLRVAAGQS